MPHLQVEMLQKIGVHIPSLEGDEDDLTDAALEIVKKKTITEQICREYQQCLQHTYSVTHAWLHLKTNNN